MKKDISKRDLAKLQVIETLADLNQGWWPDWENDEPKWEPGIDHRTKTITITMDSTYSFLEDCYQAKTKEVWEQTIEKLGQKTVELALWATSKED